MLNRQKLLQEMSNRAPSIFFDLADELSLAKQVWEEIARNNEFATQVHSADNLTLPHWQGALDSHFSIEKLESNYQVCSVDGSQIYPDRHQGRACYLINIGWVQLMYAREGSTMNRNSEPSVLLAEDGPDESSIDQVNSRRSELELIESFKLSKKMVAAHPEVPFLCLIDGSLIFWHLQSKPLEVKHRYFTSSLTVLQQFYENNIPVAGYISLPKSKELIHLVRFALEQGFYLPKNTGAISHIVDADLMALFLPVNTRSIIFEHNSSIADQYPAALKPSFFYMRTEQEIARVEIPRWIAQKPLLIDLVASIIMDQVDKGQGYPVAVAEAHEAAVVKGADRDYFYRLLEQFTARFKQRYIVSQKSLKKRGMHV